MPPPKPQHGFTLIELMIVIAIIAILSVFGVPYYQQYMDRTKVMEGIQLAQQVKLAVQEYVMVHHKLPTQATNTSLSIPNPTSLSGQYVNQISVSGDGVITITYKEALGTLILAPKLTGQRISWSCPGGTLIAVNRSWQTHSKPV